MTTFRILIALAIIIIVMLFTCPDSGKHVDKVSEDVAEYVQENIGKEDYSGLLESVVGNAIAGTIGENIVRFYIQSQLKVDDYAVLNVGTLKYKGEEHVVSIGAFNHVFSLVNAYKKYGFDKK